MNPANGNECTVISLGDRDVVEENGWTTWDALGYLVLFLSADLRAHSACLLHRQAVEDHLEQLEMAFPALIKAAREKVPIEQMARVLRALITEEITIRDLRSILEQMLDYDYIVTDPARYIIFDDRLPLPEPPDEAWFNAPGNLTAFVRAGMKRYISHKYTRGQSTLIVYLLHPDIEGILSEHQRQGTLPDESQCEELLDEVRIEAEAFPVTASIPAILTTIDVRPILREIIAPEFPRLPVLSYQELSPDLNIQPIARIALDT